MLKRVVVTGIGCVTPLGVTVDATWNNIIAGNCGISKILDKDYKHLPCTIAGTVDYTPQLSGNEKRSANRTTGFALGSADEALRQSRLLDSSHVDRARIGVCFGSSLAGFADNVQTARNVDESKKRGYRRISPFFVPRILDNMTAGAIAMRHKLHGPNHSCGTACTTGGHAIGDAYNLIRLGMADAMIAGSGEACIHPLALGAFAQAQALCTNSNETPSSSCRPFDSERSGFVMSEGAGVVVLESLDSAIKRSAEILTEIVGYGMSADAHHITAPHDQGYGAFLAMKGAIGDVDPSDITYINAHATSTPLGDLAEGTAIRKLFYSDQSGTTRRPLISSSKGNLGHLLGGSGSVEAVICVKVMVEKTIPQTLNLKNPCINLEHVLVPTAVDAVDYALTNSFGFGGTNASLLFKRFVR